MISAAIPLLLAVRPLLPQHTSAHGNYVSAPDSVTSAPGSDTSATIAMPLHPVLILLLSKKMKADYYHSHSTKPNQFCLEIILCRIHGAFDYLIYPYYPAYMN